MRNALPLLLLAACTPDVEPLRGLPDVAGENPLVREQPAFPFPADFYLEEADTPTGHRVAIAQNALPDALLSETFSSLDGWSRMPVILSQFPGGVDPGSLPNPADPSASLADDSAVWLINATTGERVPVLAEVDATTKLIERQSLIVRPQIALDWSTTHVVIIKTTLRAADGSELPVRDTFRALRDEIPTDSNTVEQWRLPFETVNQVIYDQGLEREEVLLAWSFTTGSQEAVTTPMLSMVDSMMDASLGAFAVDEVTSNDANAIVRGHFDAPNFIGPDGTLVLDADYRAIAQGTYEVPVQVTVPVTVTEARPVILFGHGFFASIDEPTWSSLQGLMQPNQFTAVTTDFPGFREDDLIATTGVLGGDVNRIDEVVAQNMQGQANFAALARLLQDGLDDTIEVDHGDGAFKPLDADRLTYMGTSNGGTQGFTIMSTTPHIEHGVLVVPGGAMAHMLERATQWNTLGGLLKNQFDDPRELQMVIGLSQTQLDPMDGINFVDHMLADPFPGRPEKTVVIHEATGDTQVANMITEVMARTAGFKAWDPSPRELWGFERITPSDSAVDTTSAYTIYDEGYAPNPAGNVAPPEENGAHRSIRDIPAYRTNVAHFINTHEIINVCDGACDPE